MDEQAKGETVNDMSGTSGAVIQSRTIEGGVNVHLSSADRAPIPHQLPGAPKVFVGRRRERDHLEALLSTRRVDSGGNRNVVLLCGAAGAGKSALSVVCSRKMAAEFPDGELYADLHGYSAGQPIGPETVLVGFLQALGVPPLSIPGHLDAQAALYRTLISGRRILILLDNTDSADRVRPLLGGSDKSFFLITSRSRLSGLVAREGAYRMPLDNLSPEEALELLHSIIGDRVEQEAAMAEELARLCAYLPLALRVAAEHVVTNPDASLEELVSELSEEADRLDLFTPEDDEGTAVRSVFSWSYRGLPTDAALTFRLLGITPGKDIAFDAVEELVELPRRRTRRALECLTNVHLLEQKKRGRYSFHDLLRAYAAELGEEEDSVEERNSALYRLSTWYLAKAQAAERIITPGRSVFVRSSRVPADSHRFDSYELALAWCDTEKSNVIDVARRAGEAGDYEAAAGLANMMWGYFNIRKCWPEWISCNEIGIAAARSAGDRTTEAWILTSSGVAYRNLRQTQKSVESHERAIEIFGELGDRVGFGFAHNNLANAYSDAGEFVLALQNFEIARECFSSLSLPAKGKRGLAVTLNSMAVTYNSMGQYDEGRRAAESALGTLRQLGDNHGVAFALNNLGGAYLGTGDYNRAEQSFIAALELRESIGDLYGAARTLLTLGDVQSTRGNAAAARESWNRALDFFGGLGAPEVADAEGRLNLRDGEESSSES
ncbi:tetratricopeptide repeat protein [Streptomyces griseoloalbus]|uniref:ATP-binding protein n=1 Tax=Streptomyces griseoloalbus TaxID=67303 RepID=UPI0033AE92FE